MTKEKPPNKEEIHDRPEEITLSRFGEIVSSYLDNEADAEEIKLISACVRRREDCRDLLAKMTKIHTCALKMYSKRPERIRGYGKISAEFRKGRLGYSVIRERIENIGLVGAGAAMCVVFIIAFF